MLWWVFALIATLFTAFVMIIDKKLLLKEHSMEFSAIFSFTRAILILAFIPFVSFNLSLKSLLFIYLISWFGTLGFFFLVKSIRHMELGSILPLINFIPALVAILGIFLLGESLGIFQWLGIFLIVLGGYILETRHFTHYGVFFNKIKRSKGLHYVFLSIIFYSFSAIGDRYVLTNITNVITFLFYVFIFIAFNFLILSLFTHLGIENIKTNLKRNWKLFALSVFLATIAIFCKTYSISLESPSLVLGVNRLSVLFSVLLAGAFLHENNLHKKLISSVIMLVGVLLIII